MAVDLSLLAVYAVSIFVILFVLDEIGALPPQQSGARTPPPRLRPAQRTATMSDDANPLPSPTPDVA
jgi:hypothetical protein